MPFTCKYCSQTFCEEHRLPENHMCPALPSFNKWPHARMSLEREKATLKMVGLVGGIIEMLGMGVINAVYSDTRWPTSRGIKLLLDLLSLGPSNPYAILSGVLIYFFFYRWATKIEEIRAGKYDVVWILSFVSMIVLSYALWSGVLVY